MTLIERRNPTSPIAPLKEFLVAEQVRMKFSYTVILLLSHHCVLFDALGGMLHLF